jgi:hypothetical protein
MVCDKLGVGYMVCKAGCTNPPSSPLQPSPYSTSIYLRTAPVHALFASNHNVIWIPKETFVHLRYMISEQALYKWAEIKFGTSRCHRIKFCNNASGDYGSYDWEGTIRVNLRMCRSPRTIYKVIAHEWTHAQQSYRAYKYWSSRTTYWKHPLEREARHREKLV